MTVSTTGNRAEYSLTGTTASFAFASGGVNFTIFDDDDLKVYVDGVLKTKTTHYTVTINTNNEATVTFVSSPSDYRPVSGQEVVLVREVPLTQTTNYQNNNIFDAETLEKSIDLETMKAQQVSINTDRAIKFSDTATGITSSVTEITAPSATRANKLISFDASGNIQTTQEIGTLKGDWATSTVYVQRDLAKQASASEGSTQDNIYICIEAHTSTGSYLTENDSSKWTLVLDVATASGGVNESAAWARKVDGIVDATTGSDDFSSRAYAIGGTGVTDTSGKGSAKDWASKAEDAKVDTSEYSAKHYSLKASASASSASGSAGTATTKAGEASTSEGNALSYKDDAESAKTASELALDTFDDRFLGSKDSVPAKDNDDNDLLEGALYWNSISKSLFVWDGSAWVNLKTAVDGDTVTSSDGNNLVLTTVADGENVVINSTTGTSGNTILLPKVRATTNNYVLAMSDITDGTTEWAETQVSPALTSFTGKLNAYEAPHAITGTTNSTATISALSSTTGLVDADGVLYPDMQISGSGILAGTTIASINTGASTLVLSQAASTGASGVDLKIQKTPDEKGGGTLVLTGTDFGNDTSGITVQIFAASEGGSGIAATYISSLSGTSCTAEWTGNEASYSGFSGDYWVEIKKGSLTSDRVSSGENMTGDPTISDFTVSDATISSVPVADQKLTLGTYGGPVAGGGADADTKLFLNFDRGGGTDIEDSSNIGGNGHHFDVSNDAIIKSSPFGDGKSAMYFDGTDDLFTVANNADFSVSSGEAWSLDFWYMKFSAGGLVSLVGITDNDANETNRAFDVYVGGSGQLIFYAAGASVWSINDDDSGIVRPNGVWTHVAITYGGSGDANYRVYGDGVLYQTITETENIDSESGHQGMAFGVTNDGSGHIEGYLDEIRWVKGENPFTTTTGFTPSQIRYGTSGATHEASNSSNVKLLIHSNESDAEDTNGHLPSIIGNTAQWYPSTTQKRSWYSSSWRNDTGGGYLTTAKKIPAISEAFTIDGWVWVDDGQSGYGYIWDLRCTDDQVLQGIFVDTKTNGSCPLYFTTGAVTATSTITHSAWHHMAYIQNADGDWGFFMDGIQINATNYYSTSNNGKVPDEGTMFTIGAKFDLGNQLKGYFQDWRLSSAEIFTVSGTLGTTGATITAPTSAPVVDSNTVFLSRGNGMDYADSSASEHDVTPTGAYHSQGHGGIAPAMTWPASGKATGSCGCYFDGDGDYLSIPTSTDFDFGTGNFTIDFWMYVQSIGDYDGIITFDGPSVGADVCFGFKSADNKLYFFSDAGGSEDEVNSGDAISLNQWYHVAVVRSSTTLTKFYLDGTEKTSSTNNYTFNTDSGGIKVGRFYEADDEKYFHGYLDGIRISNVARTITLPTKIYGALGPATTDIGTITLAGSATPAADLAFTEMASSLPAGLTLTDGGTSGATDPNGDSVLAAKAHITGTLTAPASDTTTGNIRIQAKAGADDARVTEIRESNQVGALTLTNKSTGAPVLFNARRYMGNATARGITGFGFRPDFVWAKNRDTDDSHQLFDSVRGPLNRWYAEAVAIENDDAGTLTSFNRDGFSIGTHADVNTTDEAYVAWGFKAGEGDTTSGDTTGAGTAKTFTRSVNTAGGFSIIKYVGNGSDGHKIPHGLASAPDFVICKNRDGDEDHAPVFHSSTGSDGSTQRGILGMDIAFSDDGGQYWSDSFPDDDDVYLGDTEHNNQNNKNLIMYCWHSVTGVSKFGSFDWSASGNHTVSGLSFQPRFVMIKCIEAASSWLIWDEFRGFGTTAYYLKADTSTAELTGNPNKGCAVTNSSFTIGSALREDAEWIYMAFA